MARMHVLTAGLATCLLGATLVSAQTTPIPDSCPPPPDSALPASAFYTGAGDSSFVRGRFATAADAYTCALQASPDDTGALVKRGYAYAALGDADRAFDDYETALAEDEAYAPAYTHRGVLYTRLGNFGLAINDFTLAISLAPADPAPLINRAIVHAIEGDMAAALDDLAAAENLTPDYPPLHAAYATLYSAMAMQHYQRYAVLTGNAPLPGGSPTDVLIGLDDALRTGDFSLWLPLLTPTSRLSP